MGRRGAVPLDRLADVKIDAINMIAVIVPKSTDTSLDRINIAITGVLAVLHSSKTTWDHAAERAAKNKETIHDDAHLEAKS